MKLYVVRHGEYDANVKGIMNYNPNVIMHLTSKGVEQAKGVREKLADINFDKCFISEMTRTQETANVILDSVDFEKEVDLELDESRVGVDGMPVPEVHKILVDSDDPWRCKAGGAESFEDVRVRVFDFIERLKENEYGNVLIVTHMCILWMFKMYFEKYSEDEIFEMNLPNCAILEYELK